jgi:hypothetical protein
MVVSALMRLPPLINLKILKKPKQDQPSLPSSPIKPTATIATKYVGGGPPDLATPPSRWI